MPAANTDSGARAVQPKPKKVRVRKAKPTPDTAQQAQARVQEQGYKSQAHAVRLVGNRQRGVSGSSPSGDRPQGRAKQMTSPQVKAGVKAARIRVKGAQGRGAGTRAVKDALSGKGPIVDANAKLAKKLAPAIAEHLGVGGIPGVRGLDRRFVEDALNLPSQVVPSAYVPAAGAVEAAKGRPQRLKAFVKTVKATDPVYNTAAAGVSAIKGDSAAAKKHLQAAAKTASEHPGFTAAEVYGLKGGVGRGAGRAVRGAAKVTGSKTLKALGSKEKVPKTLPGTSLEEKRQHSPDLIRKAETVVRERDLRKRAAAKQVEADAETNPARKQQLEHQARNLNPDVLREGGRLESGGIVKRVDEHVAAVESVRKLHAAKVTSATRRQTRVRHAGPVTNLVAQRIVRPEVGDLKAYLAELDAEHAKTGEHALGPAEARASETLRHHLRKAVAKAEGGKLDLAKVKAVADEFAKTSAEGQKGLVKRGMLDSEQARRRVVMPYAVRRMGAKHNGDELVLPRKVIRVRGGKRTVTTEDTPLSTAAVEAHMRQHGEGPPAYVSQAPNARGAGNFYQSSAKPAKISSAKFTGRATVRGTFDAHPDTLAEAAARTQTLTDQFDHFQRFIHEFGHRDPRGRGGIKTVRNKATADKLAADLSVKHGIGWKAIRVNPFGATKKQLHAMLEGSTDTQPIHDAIESALKGEGTEGPWAIVPEAAAKRLQEHTRLMSPGNAGRVARKVSSSFRQTVLATSPKWLVNNAAEAGFRSALARAGVRSYFTGRRVLKRTDQNPEGEMLRARAVGGGHYAMADRLAIHTNVEAFTDGAVKDMARGLSAMWKAPGPKHVASLWHGYTHFVFNVVNHYVEQQFQTAMFGKAVRDTLLDDRLLKLSNDAMDQAAKGAVNPATAVQLGRAVDRMYGRYGKFSPTERAAIALYTPFIAWYLNSVYFVTRTLPQDHPVALGLIASAEMATAEWRKEHGLDQFVEGRVPGFLQGSIPAANGVKYRAPTNSLPFGAFTDPLGNAAGAVLPQASGFLSAFQGRDWKGKELRDANGDPLDTIGKAKAAVGDFLGATIPVLAAKTQIQKGPAGQLNSVTGKVQPKAAATAAAPPVPSSSTKVRLGAAPTGTKIRLGRAPSGLKIRLGR